MNDDGKFDRDAIVIGAGFAGLYAVHKLRNEMRLSVEAFESGSDVGGTWYWNRYPGARSDAESYVYCYSFSPELLQEWNWKGKYPDQEELRSYFGHVADTFDLRRSFRFNTRVVSAHYDDVDGGWTVRTDDGRTWTARFLIAGLGLLTTARYVPEFAGMETFEGECHHTGAWPDGVDLSGKRVGVIGTGSTGVQLIPEVARRARELTVFQRTPQFTIPARHHTVDQAFLDDVKRRYDEIWKAAQSSVGGFPWQHNGRSAHDDTAAEREETFERLWLRGGFEFLFASYKDLLTDAKANEYVSDFVRGKIRERVEDPETVADLLPFSYPFGARRPIVDTEYFETYNRDNVTLVNVKRDPIVLIDAAGVRTAGNRYDLDVLIFATGFDAVTGPFFKIDIRGRHDLSLREHWQNGPRTYLGLAVRNFPNLFTISGPGSPFSNAPVVIEHHVDWIARCIAHFRSSGQQTIEVSAEAEEAWMEEIEEKAKSTLIHGTESWFSGANVPGKVRSTQFYIGSYGLYRRRCESVAAGGYDGFVGLPDAASLDPVAGKL